MSGLRHLKTFFDIWKKVYEQSYMKHLIMSRKEVFAICITMALIGLTSRNQLELSPSLLEEKKITFHLSIQFFSFSTFLCREKEMLLSGTPFKISISILTNLIFCRERFSLICVILFIFLHKTRHIL